VSAGTEGYGDATLLEEIARWALLVLLLAALCYLAAQA
jgi:hypothetical protein